MGVPTLEVGYTLATTGRGDHEVHKGHAAGKKIVELKCACFGWQYIHLWCGVVIVTAAWRLGVYPFVWLHPQAYIRRNM
jgi:hypothetical protein